MANGGYVVVQDWMCEMLGDLYASYIYAIIFEFSQDGKNLFTRSPKWLADKCIISVDKVNGILRRLVLSGCIVESVEYINGDKFCYYRAVIPDNTMV